MGAQTVPARPSRRAYIDWLRGVAVLIMIMWHSIDSWTLTIGRDSFAFKTVIFLAGWAAPLFLFLAGVSVPLAGVARMARGLDRHAASRLIQRRGWEVFVLAHLFRLQSFLLNPHASWNGLLKPDILNILGLAIVFAAFAWGRARTTHELVWWLIVPSAIIAGVLTPLAPTWWWPTLLHPRLEGYIRVVNNNAVFSLFPTAAYLLVGAFVGTLVAAHDDRDGRFQRQMARWGAVLLAAGGLMALVPWPRAIGFWTDPIAIVAWRIGAMMLMMTLSWRWLLHRETSASDPLIVFGRTSLFVYWVHVELAYGNVSYPLHHALPLPWSVLAYAGLTAGMLWLARVWMRRPAGPIVPVHMAAAVE